MSPLISVIIPAYNTQDYLPRCLDSLLCQTLPDFELLLINDGSTDGTAAVADRYAEADSRVKVIRKEHGGVSSARNRGLEVARGEFITFVDSDDMVQPTYLEKLYAVLCETGADISAVAHSEDYPSRRKLICCFTKQLYTQDEINHQGLLSNCWMHMFRRASMTVFRFAEDIRYGEDFLFCMQNFYGKPGNTLATSSEYLYVYNKSDLTAATLQEFQPKRMSEIEAFHRIQKVVQNYPIVLDMVNKNMGRVIWSAYYELLATDGCDRYPDETKTLRQKFLEYHKFFVKTLRFRSRIIPWVCIRSERLGKRVIRVKGRFISKRKTS